jgi:hypothetical protein
MKKQNIDKNIKKNPMSDKTKGAIFLALGAFAVIIICITIYAQTEETGRLTEKNIPINTKQVTQ